MASDRALRALRALPAPAAPRPWVLTVGGVFRGRFATRQAGMRAIERPYRPGNALLRRDGPGRQRGEEWIRHRGVWFRNGVVAVAVGAAAEGS